MEDILPIEGCNLAIAFFFPDNDNIVNCHKSFLYSTAA